MLPQTINPYDIGDSALFYGEGLDYIISVLPGESLEDAILDILEMSGYFPTPFTPAFEAEVISIVKNVENSYKNNKCRSMYGGGQMSFVNAMSIPSFIDADTVDTIPSRVTDIESYIPQRGLSVDQQSPLFLATLIGKYNYEYYNVAIDEGDTDWQDAFDAALTSATANLPFWVTAGMEGALLGYNISPRGLIPTTAGIVSNQIISSLIGALTTTVGVVYYKWVKRVEILKECSCDTHHNISELSLNYSNGQMELHYKGKIDANGYLSLYLLVNDKNKNNILTSNMKIDVTSKAYRLSVNIPLKAEANNLAKIINKGNAASIAMTIEEQINKYSEEHSISDFSNEVLQGLFYYRAVFKAIGRSYSGGAGTNERNNIEITNYNGYIVGLSPYVAKEDIIINVPHLFTYLQNYSLSRLTNEDISYIINKLDGYSNISMIGLEMLLWGTVSNTSDISIPPDPPKPDCYILCGTDCGCCGNYEGQCWYASDLCWVHDYMCQTCKPPWFCLAGCVPSRCSTFSFGD